MSEEQTTPDQTEADGPTDAEILEQLKAKATMLGLRFHPSIKAETLREKINEKMAEPKEAATTDPDETGDEDEDEDEAPVQMTPQQIRQKQRAEEMKMVRVRIANMNPSKADLGGEIFCVRTKYLGAVKKFIPFGEATDDGYHIPYILYKAMKARKFLSVRTKTDQRTGQIDVKTRWVPEFNIEVLDDLTPAELQELATNQAARMGVAE